MAKEKSSSEDELIHEITRRLRETLSPVKFSITSLSEAHKKHTKLHKGGGHFKLDVVSEVFEGLSKVNRERWVTSALGDLMGGKIHALSMVLKSPRESSHDFVG